MDLVPCCQFRKSLENCELVRSLLALCCALFRDCGSGLHMFLCIYPSVRLSSSPSSITLLLGTIQCRNQVDCSPTLLPQNGYCFQYFLFFFLR